MSGHRGRTWKIRTIRGKFLMLTLLLTIVPMCVLTFTFYRIAVHSLVNKAEEHATQSRQMSGNFLNRTISDLNDLTNAILGNPEVQTILQLRPADDYDYLRNVERLNKIIRAQTQTKPYIISTLVYAPSGGEFQSFYQGNDSIRFGGLPTLQEARIYYDRLSRNNRIMWHDGSPFKDINGSSVDQEHLYVGKLLRRTEGNYEDLGFLMLEIEKSNFFSGISILKPDEKSQFWIVDSGGNPIYWMPEKAQADSRALREVAESAIRTPTQDKSWTDWNGKRAMISYAPLETNKWTLLHVADSDTLFRDANQIGKWTIETFLAVLVIGWVIAYRLSNTIRRPLRSLRSLMGSTTGVVPAHAPFDPMDEVGQIGERFLRMHRENQQLNDQVLEALLSRKEAEFRALQAQINPHFLYNTLESLKGLSLANGQNEMSEVIGAIGKFFRIALSQGSEEIRVADEADHASAYVRVQQFRFKDKFEWISEIDEEVLSYYVPKLIFQPIVENAIYHGIKMKKEVVYLMLSGVKEEGRLRFSISDDGNGIPEERLSEIRSVLNGASNEGKAIGFGLRNVHDRLRHYGPEFGVQIASEYGKYTTVTLSVPIREAKSEGGKAHVAIADR
ncbi:sensor histidine kinase [Cohnella endophytica]|uniref:Sensor histidine kinase n=1 Tax=Cohnella endophytica TaxID=2419778 RepID=A0A494XTY3_9BACL|nr:sensor histidine kinase [Cohnella endophytica]RKP54093.1 sensor histidine kinase [Cohnella endophytica]